MKLLFGTQFYTPSIGGVQEVMRQLAEELVARGHRVTIATTASPARDFTVLNGVEIAQFDIAGNYATGMAGQVKEFQAFVLRERFDLIMVMAAQQWTFDALWPVLDRLDGTRTVFIPSGFSGLYDPVFADYFRKMPEILAKIDHLVFHSTKYRDIDFARENGLDRFSVIPCGASDKTFNVPRDTAFRARHGIPEDSFLFLTVGSFTGLKGHLELAKAFALLDLPRDRHATLLMNGNVLPVAEGGARGVIRKLTSLLRTRGPAYIVRQVFGKLLRAGATPQGIARQVNAAQASKTFLITDFPRNELTQAFINADLFVFASNVEYSPLVLFETAAAGTPFLSVTVGNTPEIARWTGAGVICPSWVDQRGYTRVDEQVLAGQMRELMDQGERLAQLGDAGRGNWLEHYTWKAIARRYEALFVQLVNNRPER